MLVLKERMISGHEIKKSTVIKSTRTELLGQFLLDLDRLPVQEQKKKDDIQVKRKSKIR